MKLKVLISVVLAAVLCGSANMAAAESKVRIMKPKSFVPVIKKEPPTPGRRAGQVMLTDRQKRLLSGAGAFAIYGPSKPISREQILKMREMRQRNKRSSLEGAPGKSEARLAAIMGSPAMSAAASVAKSVTAAVASMAKLVNNRAYWQEDQWTTWVTQSETSSAVWGSHIVVGWNDTETYYNGSYSSLTNWAVSHDGGTTFTDSLTGLPTYSAPGITDTYGDPAVDVDASGNFWFATLAVYDDGLGNGLASLFNAIAVYESTDFGDSFTLIDSVVGVLTSDVLDKEMIVVDRVNNKVYVTYTLFPGGGGYEIHCWNVTADTDNLVVSNPNGVQGSVPAVDRAGNVYVAYESGDPNVAPPSIRIAKSTDSGATFPTDNLVYGPFTSAGDPLGDSNNLCGRNALKGNIRINEFPSLAIDTRASGTGAGNLYIAFNARDFSPGVSVSTNLGPVLVTPVDVVITRSINGGTTWSSPIKAYTRAAGDYNDKFMPWITVGGTGKVGLVYYERKNVPYTGGLFGSQPNWWISTIVRRLGPGLGVIDAVKVSPAFPTVVNNDDTDLCYMGDYNSISANRQSAGEGFFVFWGDNRLGDADIRFAKVTP